MNAPIRATINPLPLSKTKWCPKKLSQKHKTIVALHLQNIKREEIGAVCGCTPEYVSMVVATPLAQQYMAELEAYQDDRLRRLYSKSVDAIDRGLSCGDSDVELKAAKLQMEAVGKLKPQAGNEKSAEDVVAQILAQVNITVNTGAQNGTGNATLQHEPQEGSSREE